MPTIKAQFGPNYREVEIGEIAYVAQNKPLKLDCGMEVSNIPVAYQSYGTLNKDKSNAILLFHGLTGDQYVLGPHPVTGKPGWWEHLVGDGKLIDTQKFFVLCANTIGGCMGSFGPKSINPETKKPYNLDFPVLTIADMVRAQALLLEHLGISQLFAAIGGSMGGMLALELASKYPKLAKSVVAIATAARHTAQNIAFHEIGRQAILADPNWCKGNYINEQKYPSKGLAIGRMTAHVTYLSEAALHRKFGRGLQKRETISYGFDADFQVESYLRHQGFTFVERFDPNSYLYITRAMDYFDLIGEHKGVLSHAFNDCTSKFCIISFSSDWLFPQSESRHIIHALSASGAAVTALDIESDKGHDAFLLDEPEFFDTLRGFLGSLD